MGSAIVITSGKGGTGKTAMTCGIGSALAKSGKRVLCLDMDVGLRNLDLALGMNDRALMDFTDVLFGRCTLARAAVEHPKLPGLFLLTAPVHFDRRRAVSTGAMQALMKQILAQYDFCLIDCPAGIGQGFHLAASCADRAILTVTNDSAALRDAQQVVLQLRPYGIPAKLVVNRVSRWMVRKIQMNVDDAMDMARLPLLGVIPEDRKVPVANAKGELLVTQQSRGAARGYENIAQRLCGKRVPIGWK